MKRVETKGQTWDADRIRTLLLTNDRAVERALVVLFDRQTADEQRTEDTRHLNLQGFTPYDARIMSSMAKWVLRGRHLTFKQLAYLRRGTKHFPSRIGKYTGQLLTVAADKAA